MIRQISIKNFKSIEDLTLDLGRTNVLIGENGCGKSNILEAIAMASASFNQSLNNEFLASRGIRATNPKFMRSAFDKKSMDQPIQVSVQIENVEKPIVCSLQNDNKPYAHWVEQNYITTLAHNVSKLLFDSPTKNELSTDQKETIISSFATGLSLDGTNVPLPDPFNELALRLRQLILDKRLKDFLIYSPLNDALRNFEQEGQIQPLGINGEGLFRLLKHMGTAIETREDFNLLKEKLQFLDWFEDLSISEDPSTNERVILLHDRYIDKESGLFDQRNANEGFLFVLFYFTLFISDLTPGFFAVDNIDASLNPRLCQTLMKELAFLSDKRNKQVIFTTHNPSILDGLNLNDDEQRLFVVTRNRAGKTNIKRITKKTTPQEGLHIRLSEAFTNGYLGGLPKNF